MALVHPRLRLLWNGRNRPRSMYGTIRCKRYSTASPAGHGQPDAAYAVAGLGNQLWPVLHPQYCQRAAGAHETLSSSIDELRASLTVLGIRVVPRQARRIPAIRPGGWHCRHSAHFESNPPDDGHCLTADRQLAGARLQPLGPGPDDATCRQPREFLVGQPAPLTQYLFIVLAKGRRWTPQPFPLAGQLREGRCGI